MIWGVVQFTSSWSTMGNTNWDAFAFCIFLPDVFGLRDKNHHDFLGRTRNIKKCHFGTHSGYPRHNESVFQPFLLVFETGSSPAGLVAIKLIT